VGKTVPLGGLCNSLEQAKVLTYCKTPYLGSDADTQISDSISWMHLKHFRY